MHATFFLAAWGLVALALFKAISWVVENRRHAGTWRFGGDSRTFPDLM